MMLENDRLSWFNVIQSYLTSYTKIKRIVACFVRSVETSPVYQININPSPVNGNEKLSVLIKTRKLKVQRGLWSTRARMISCAKSKLFSKLCMVRWSLYILKKIFGMSAETSWMRPIFRTAGIPRWSWNLRRMDSRSDQSLFSFLSRVFFLTHGKLAAFFEAPFFSVNRNKGFVFIIVLPELNRLVR